MSDAFMTNEPLDTPDVKFEELVGEGKKYRDPDTAAKAIVEKDRFIEQLKRENAEAREAITKRANEEEFLRKLEALTKAKSPDAGEPPPAQGTVEQPAVTPESIDEILDKREAKRKADANLDQAVSKLQELYGDDYRRIVAKQAQTLNMTTAELTALAAKSPAAFFRTLGIEGQQKGAPDAFAPPRSTVSVPTTQTNVKNYAHFQKLRAEKGDTWYFSPTVQQDVWNAVKELGEEAFYKR